MVFIALRVTTHNIPAAVNTHNNAYEHEEKYKVLRKHPYFFHSNYILNTVIFDLKQYLKTIQRYIIGEELIKKGKKPMVHIQYHIYMEVMDDVKKDTLQKHCRDKFEWKGKEMYSLQVQNQFDEESEKRWWSYPLKYKVLQKFGDFSPMDLEQMEILAKEEKEETQELSATQKKHDQFKNHFRDKMYQSFKEKYDLASTPTNKTLWCDIAKYYYDCGKTPPYHILDDVVDDIKVYLGYMSIEELYDIRHN